MVCQHSGCKAGHHGQWVLGWEVTSGSHGPWHPVNIDLFCHPDIMNTTGCKTINLIFFIKVLKYYYFTDSSFQGRSGEYTINLVLL